MKYYVEKSNIDNQPSHDGYYFTNYGRLQYRSGVPGLWYDLTGMPCDSPFWYLEECNGELKEKADKWDKLEKQLDEFYSREEEQEDGLIAIGEMAAIAFGYL